MSPQVSQTIGLLDVEQVGPDQFRAGQPASSALAQVFGGQVAAQMLAAAVRTVDPVRPPHALHAQFLRRGDASRPIELQVQRPLDGGSFAVRLVNAVQPHGVIATATASFHKPEGGFLHESAMPDVPAAEDCTPLFDVAMNRSRIPSEEWRREFREFDLRYVPVANPAATALPGEGVRQRIWFRFALPWSSTPPSSAAEQPASMPHPALPTLLLAYISDFSLLSATLPAHGFLLGDPEIQRATLSHSIYLHGPVDPAQWMLYDQSSAWAGAGRGLASARIYSADGRLIASAAQEGLVRPRGQLREFLGLSPR